MDEVAPEGMTRREALKRGAAVAGEVWAVPAIQMFNIAAAGAHDENGNTSTIAGSNGAPSSTTGSGG